MQTTLHLGMASSDQTRGAHCPLGILECTNGALTYLEMRHWRILGPIINHTEKGAFRQIISHLRLIASEPLVYPHVFIGPVTYKLLCVE